MPRPQTFITARLAKLALAIAAALPGAWSGPRPGRPALARRAMHLLRDHCVRCHNAKKTKGDLNLTEACARAQGRRRRPGTHPRPSCGEPHVPVSSPRQRPPHAAEKAVERRTDCRAWPMDRGRGRVAARRTGHRGQVGRPRCAWPTAQRLPAGVRPRPLAG